VSLNEVYRYAYDNTLRASSRTLAGTQHPSFRYALSGHGDLTLTWLTSRDRRRGWFSFPPGRSYLILQGDSDGPVVAEVGLRDRHRTISVRAGTYFIRARGRADLLEGSVSVAAGAHRGVREEDLDRIAYARLVRKGDGILGRVRGMQVALRARSALANSSGMDGGAALAYAIDTSHFNIALRLAYWHAGFRQSEVQDGALDRIEADVEELGLELRLGKAWDTPAITVEPFMVLGGGAMWQRFDTLRKAPDRVSGAGHADLGAAIRRDAGRNVYLLLETALQTYWFRRRSEGGDVAPSTSFSVTGGVGWWF
jgi:hypothetical protein